MVVAILKMACAHSKPEDGVVVDEKGQLTMLGGFWRSSLSEFCRDDFSAWKEAISTRRLEMPDWFPSVGDVWEQIALARDLSNGKPSNEAPKIDLLPHETGTDHLRARTTGTNPAYGPMQAEWAKKQGESSKDYGDRMLVECEKIMPGLSALRKLRELRRQQAEADHADH